jgi:hypothetical protein
MDTSRPLNQNSTLPLTANGTTTIQLKALLQELVDHQPNVCVRLRLLGQMWMPNFMRPVRMLGKGIILFDETIMEYKVVQELRDVMQFELDSPYKEAQPFFHYEVRPSLE